jgi:hypothetical protein
MAKIHTSHVASRKLHSAGALGALRTMTKFFIVTASTLAFASAAVAADMPTRQPPPPTPVVGKAPVGKLPIPIVGKMPLGKAPPPPPPVIARG